MDKSPFLLFRQLARPQVVPLREGVAMGYKGAVLMLILFMSLLRLVLASVMELGTDESYYWLYAQRLQWNYFDHPPLVALWGNLFTVPLNLDDYELFVRLGSIAGSAAAIWFIFKTTSLLHSERAGWYAAVLYATSFYASFVAGLLLMPDAPQMVFWTFSLWMIARIKKEDRNWLSWILLGIGVGLCIMSKVHGVLIWLGMGLYILVLKRTWLGLPQLYLAVLLTAVVASPILIWNLQHDFVTYRFHSQRVVLNGWAPQPLKLLNEVLGQLLFNNPVQVVLSALTVTAGYSRLRPLVPRLSVFLFMSLPLIIVLLVVSLFRTVYPHWSGPAYVSLLPVAAIFLAQSKHPQAAARWLKWSIGAFLIFALGWPLANHAYPGTWGSKNKLTLGQGDITLDRFGWEEGGAAFGRFYQDAVAQGTVPRHTPLICPTWWGAHVEYYFCRPLQLPMIGLGSMQQLHHYYWTNAMRVAGVNFDQAFCVVPSDEYYEVGQTFAAYYTKAELVKVLSFDRSGRPARKFYIYRLSGWKGTVPRVK